ncbi:MAG: hypothetical protein EDM75_01555, partial [Chlorobiota bacterium]
MLLGIIFFVASLFGRDAVINAPPALNMEIAASAAADTAGTVASELSSMVKLKLLTSKQARKLAEILSPVEVDYIDPKGIRKKGVLIVHKNVAETVRKIFREMADSGFVIEKIEPMSKYDWSDEKSMNANNTSA